MTYISVNRVQYVFRLNQSCSAVHNMQVLNAGPRLCLSSTAKGRGFSEHLRMKDSDVCRLLVLPF
jgi:hypothetical protein